MAPKKKKGFSRMDGALDHMTVYGFSKPLIRKTVNNLLKLYGDEWRFIEEDGYRVLLDVILEAQETENAHNLLEGASTSHGNTGHELVTTVSNVVSVEALQYASTSQYENTGKELVTTVSNVVSVKALQDGSTSQHENTGNELVTTVSNVVSVKALQDGSTSQHENTGNELVTTVANVVSVKALQDGSTSQHENTGYELVATESYGVSAEDASFQGSTNAESIQARSISAQEVVNEECSKDVALDKKLIQSSPFYFSDDDHSEDKVSIPSTDNATHLGSVCDKSHNPLKACARRHKPCYGWIDENDDDDAKEPSFISLEPATQNFFQHA